MSRTHPHGFPDDTPEPLGQPYSAACAFMDSVLRWCLFALVLVVVGALFALVAWLKSLPL